MKRKFCCCLISSVLLMKSAIAAALNDSSSPQMQQLMQTQLNAQQHAAGTQQKIDQIDDITAVKLQEFQNILRETALTKKYNQNLTAQVERQQQKIQTLIERRRSLTEIRKELVPTMANMISVLADFIAMDVPFLWQERQLRLSELRALQLDPSVSMSAKFRRILEAYQIETAYGYSIESWQEVLPHSESAPMVTLLRIGRMSLYYLTPDQQQGGMWDLQTRQWIPLTADDISNVSTAIKVAENNITPQLLSLPVNRIQ